MQKLFNWKVIFGFIGTLASILVPIWLWQADQASHSLTLDIVSQVSLQPNPDAAVSGLKISIDGKSVPTPYMSVITLTNDGHKPIPASDYESPIEIQLAPEINLARVQVIESNSRDISGNINSESHIVNIMPTLLNPGDIIRVALLTSGGKPTITAKARIAGVTSIKVNDATKKSLSIFFSGSLFLVALISLIAGNITASGVFTGEILLRRRSIILITIVCTLAGTLALLSLLKYVEMESFLNIMISLFILSFISGIIGYQVNKK